MIIAVFAFTTGITKCEFGAPKIPEDLCSEFDVTESYLLKVSEEREIPLNEVYYGLLDSTQIALIIEVVEREKVKEFMNDLAEWYDENYPISYLTLINHMTDEAEKVQGITAILSRRMGNYKSDMFIGKYDDCLLKAGWGKAMDELHGQASYLVTADIVSEIESALKLNSEARVKITMPEFQALVFREETKQGWREGIDKDAIKVLQKSLDSEFSEGMNNED